jgi:hypothetical protein
MIQRIKDWFSPIKVTKRIWDRFVDSGEVPVSIIRLLAFKTMKGESLTDQEFAIFCSKTAEVNDMIIQVSQNDI